MMCQKIEYIHYNPVKRGFVDFAGALAVFECAELSWDCRGLIDVCTDWR